MPDYAALILGAGAVITALAVIWKFAQRLHGHADEVRGDAVAVRDSILGRPALVDSITGEERAPALPGIGVRMAHQEKQMSLLTEAVATLAESHVRIEHVESEVRDLTGRVTLLEEASVERVVNRADSAAAWRAVEAVAKSEAPELD